MGLGELGIDKRVASVLEAQGIAKLYPPQEEAWLAIKDGRNVVVSIPTASGKSLVAYLAILHRLIARGGKALFIVPLRALASEKFDELQAFKEIGYSVGIATGDLDEKDPRLGRHDIIVCTSEKADSLLRHRTPWVEKVQCIVADEMHLIHDASRGPTLEVLLSRFRAVLPDAQIVGLSATIRNADELADWLDAELVLSDWRPVDLRVGTYMGDNLHFLDHEPRRLEAAGDPVASLVENAIAEGGQCLVFVSTRRSAEAQAQKLAGIVRAGLDAEALAALEEAVAELGDEEDAGPTHEKVIKLCKAGVCYHTAGLDAKQRRFVEIQFRAGRLKVICATPTLAAGVNTPARRVIVRDMRRFEVGAGSVPLPVMEVKQMMGRAGRPRYDPYGEAVLLAKDPDMKEILEEEYLRGEPEPVSSKLGAQGAMRIHSLASIAGGYAASEEDLHQFFGHTFWSQQVEDWVIRDRVEDVVWFLEDNGFVERDGGRLKATLFGKRTSDLYIDPMSALRMKKAMESKTDAPSAFALLHIISGCEEVYPLYLRQADDWVQGVYYENFADLLIQKEELEAALSYTKTAALLRDWMDELRQEDIEVRYNIGPGDVRTRVDSAGWMLHSFTELARAIRPEWQRPLSDLVMRLEHGVKKELLPLIRLKGVGRVRARTLYANGFKRPTDLKGVPVARLAALPGFAEKRARDLLKQVGDDPGPAKKAPAKEVRTGDAATGDDDAKQEAPDTKGQSGLQQWGMEP